MSDGARARALPVGSEVPRGPGRRREGSRPGGGPARAAPPGEPSRPGAARRTLDPREAEALRDLRQRSLHARRQVVVLLLAARVAAVRSRSRGGGRRDGRRRRTVGRRPRGPVERAELRDPRPGPLCELPRRRVQPMRRGDDRRPEGRPADRVLHRHRGRMEPDDAGAPLAAAPDPRLHGGRRGGAPRTVRMRDPRGAPRERAGRGLGVRRRRGDGRDPHAPRA